MSYKRVAIALLTVVVVGWAAWAFDSLRQTGVSLPELLVLDPGETLSTNGTPVIIPQGEIQPANDARLSRTISENAATPTTSRPLEEPEPIASEVTTSVWGPEIARRLVEPITQPLPLPPAFDWIDLFPCLQLDRELLQREPIDIAWAAQTEAQLKSYIYEHTEIPREYGNPTVHCRTTRCEVTLIRYGLEEWESPSSQEFRALIAPFFDLPEGARWSYATPEGQINIHAWHDDGVSTLHWSLVKK